MRDSQKTKAPEVIHRMLKRYTLSSLQDYRNAIKEIVQEIALLGLWRAKFFEKAAFYGGTALRILHQLDRFSEDLDFSLVQPDPHFDLVHYEKAVIEELNSFGFKATVEKKIKTKKNVVDSAFIKLNTILHLLQIGLPDGIHKGIHPGEIMKIRLEVDRDPPSGETTTESSLLLLPAPFSVKTFRLEDLFAGKVHAVLCREWKGRVKGRDWYDLVWFVSMEIPLNLPYLEQRMRQSGQWPTKTRMSRADLLNLFDQKIERLDIAAAKNDIINFVKKTSQIDLWSKDFFRQVAHKIILKQMR
ncbi:MAG: nucleotidyl transferase AbiEii/AbiGii toxin family protein [Chlamydiales bacterium]|nr:nucleotidyl transferase AbiEii/AbiGii toxin family protein [Chlamydiales bacterium]